MFLIGQTNFIYWEEDCFSIFGGHNCESSVTIIISGADGFKKFLTDLTFIIMSQHI